jgi:hypothetical protein
MVIGTESHHQDGRKNLEKQRPYKTYTIALHLGITSEEISSLLITDLIAANRQSAHLKR